MIPYPSHLHRMRHARAILTAVLALALSVLLQPGLVAQGLFSPVISVNEQVITQYEIDQRKLLLQVLRAPGDLEEEARKGLIEDRLRLSETRRAGIIPNVDDVQTGMEEFAGRANLTAEQFIGEIGKFGVEAETFRDFVTAGLAWRTLVQARFGPRAQVSEAEVDRTLALSSEGQASVRVLMSEIVLPLTPDNEAEQRALLERLRDTARSPGAFAAAARRYSAAPTARRGGRLEWLALGQLPPALRGSILTLGPGGISEPINLGPGIGIFQLRALEETEPTAAENASVEYATILIPGGNSPAARAIAQDLANNADTCDDLYTPVKSMPDEYFERIVLPSSDVPSEMAMVLAGLDPNETSYELTRQDGAFLVFTMLCGRTIVPPVNEDGEEIDLRADVRQRLFQQRIASYAAAYLEELRADAIIREQ